MILCKRNLATTILFGGTQCYYAYRSMVTTVSQLKICDFSGDNFIKVLGCYNFFECNDDTTALQRRILQTALRHNTC
jgi:hypothetical protein